MQSVQLNSFTGEEIRRLIYLFGHLKPGSEGKQQQQKGSSSERFTGEQFQSDSRVVHDINHSP